MTKNMASANFIIFVLIFCSIYLFSAALFNIKAVHLKNCTHDLTWMTFFLSGFFFYKCDFK